MNPRFPGAGTGTAALLLLLLSVARPALATEPQSQDDEPEETWGVGAHPIIGFEPESSWTFGAGATFFYNTHPGDPDQRLDEYTLNGTYSLRNQGTLSLEGTKYLRGNELFLEGDLVLTDTTGSYYGVGPNTPDSAEEEFQQAGVHPTLALLVMVLPGLSVGPEADFFYSKVYGLDPAGALAGGAVPGAGQTEEAGLGLVASYNTTNRKLYKVTGTRAELRGTLYSPYLGSSHAFGKSELDLRHYIPLPWRLVLALQTQLRSAFGEVPFFYLESLGGKGMLRGYSSERHQGYRFWGAQAELRYPIFWRFGGTAFFGAADVEESFADLGKTVRAAGGLGLRLALNRSQTINLRFDLTCNSDGELEKYIKLGEAF
jgi:hypothetical protein